MASQKVYESEKGVSLFSGLEWRVLPVGGVEKGVRTLAADREAKHYVTVKGKETEEVTRKGKTTEVVRTSVGYFVSSLDEMKPPGKSHSLAAAFAAMTRHDESSMLVLTLPSGGYAIVVVVNGMPIFDMVEADFAKAMQMTGNYLNDFPGLNVYADDAVQFPRAAMSDNLRDTLIAACSKKTELKSVPVDFVKIGVAALVLLALLGGWQMYKAKEAEAKRQALIKQQQERDPTRRYAEALGKARNNVGFTREDVLGAYATIRTLPVMIGGWSVKEIGCKAGTGCVVRLTRVIGTADTLKESTGGILKFIPPAGANLGTTDMTWDTDFKKEKLPENLTNQQDFIQGKGASILQTWVMAELSPSITAPSMWPTAPGVPKTFVNDSVVHRGNISVGNVALPQFEEAVMSAPPNVVWTDFQVTMGAITGDPLRSARVKLNGNYYVKPGALPEAVRAKNAASGAALGSSGVAAPAAGLSASAVGLGAEAPADAASRAKTTVGSASEPKNYVKGFAANPG